MSVSIRLEATPGSGPSIGLAFFVTADPARTVSVWAPVTPLLRAFVGGREVEIARPPLDLPAARQSFAAAPDRPVRIPCPVLLRFGEDGAMGDGLDWTIRCERPPDVVALEAALELDVGVIAAPRVEVTLSP